MILSAHRGYQMAPEWHLRFPDADGAWVSVKVDAEVATDLLDLAMAADECPHDVLRRIVTAGVRKMKGELWA